ncbi:SDR family oxidoreductase [Pseudokineococcus sp. 1T1Z-3]|uniref:SDR family oxidoreductase n=1 Tax=Pseudokineococcus sp. 1T1Z-3 TaxID=3132745 RepID=UPI0030A25595
MTARDPGSVQVLADAYPSTALAVPVDVTDGEQVGAAVRAAEERFGGVDLLVDDAGYGYRGAVEEGDARLFATNVHGPVVMAGPCWARMPGKASWSAVRRR